jgi:hypothetical protein
MKPVTKVSIVDTAYNDLEVEGTIINLPSILFYGYLVQIGDLLKAVLLALK